MLNEVRVRYAKGAKPNNTVEVHGIYRSDVD